MLYENIPVNINIKGFFRKIFLKIFLRDEAVKKEIIIRGALENAPRSQYSAFSLNIFPHYYKMDMTCTERGEGNVLRDEVCPSE